MASPGFDIGRNSHQQHQHQQSESAPEPAFQEAQKWIEGVTGRCFGERDFRSSLENGILLCELLSSIKPGLVKKINRLPTPIAGLDNLSLFRRGCESLGLKGTQLFDPGDLQDTSVRANLRGSDCSRKLKNVLITVYWLGKAAQNSTEYSGPTLDLKVFEGLLSQMKKESEDTENPKRNIGDSGYVDGCDAERSDSLSPPRHGRDDSFDSLDSLGSRSRQTPSPDVVIRACSEGRGSDSESDAPPRKLPDVRKDDMLTRRTSSNEPRSTVPFNQYLPNKSNPGAYIPTPLRKKRAEREEGRAGGSTATSPTGGERPFSHPETILEEGSVLKEGQVPFKRLVGPKIEAGHVRQKTVTWGGESRAEPGPWEGQEEQEVRRMQKLEKAGIRVLPATVRYSSLRHVAGEEPREEAPPPVPSIVLRKDNEFLKLQPEHAWDSEEEEGEEGRRLPDVQKDDLASRRARASRNAPRVQHFLPSACSGRDREEWEGIRRAWQQAAHSESEAPTAPRKEKEEQEEVGQGVAPQALPNVEKDDLSRRRVQSRPLPLRDPLQTFVQASITPSDLEKWQRLKMTTEPSETPPPETSHAVPRKEKEEQEEGGQGVAPQALPNVEKDDLSRRRVQSRPLPLRDPLQTFVQASITPSDLEKWQRLKMTTEPSEEPPVCQACLEKGTLPPAIRAETAEQDDLATRRVRAQRSSAPAGRQRFVHFGPVTEMDQKCWERLSIARPGQEEEEEWAGPGSEAQTLRRLLASAAVATPTIGLSSQLTERPASAGLSDRELAYLQAAGGGPDRTSPYELAYRENEALDQKLAHYREREEEEEEDEEAGEREGKQPDLEKDDMLARRTGAFQKQSGGPSFSRFLPQPVSHRGVLLVTPNTRAEALTDTPKTKAEALSDTPKTRTEALSDTPKTRTEALLDTRKTKTEALPDTPKTKTEALPDTPKTKTEALPDTHKAGTEALPDDSEREPFTDSSKSWGKMNTRRPKARQELSVATSTFHHPETQNVMLHLPGPQKTEHHHPDTQEIKRNHPDPPKYVVASAAPVPGVAEVVHVTAACLDSPDDRGDDDADYKEEGLPDLEKDDMHARRTGRFQKAPVGNVTSTFNLFLPVPGSVKFKSTPTPASNPLSPSISPAKTEQDTRRSEEVAPL
ncbi:uncharacterized protein LOC135254574 [Anguilla rostrata]|uniref:uncharacterized protein LOC135254574 n=1 Tax=Anguilla rostrata TaxID=7938 RepID=UPI0030D25CCA